MRARRIAIPPPLKILLSSMFAFDPALRPSVADMLAHPWLTGPVPSQPTIVAEMRRRKAIFTQRKAESPSPSPQPEKPHLPTGRVMQGGRRVMRPGGQ